MEHGNLLENVVFATRLNLITKDVQAQHFMEYLAEKLEQLGYTYSEALKNSDLIWDEITISDLFDHGPDVVTPGSKMPIQVIKNDSDLNDLVLFLKIATAPQN